MKRPLQAAEKKGCVRRSVGGRNGPRVEHDLNFLTRKHGAAALPTAAR